MDYLRNVFSRRPWWMSVIMVFCLFMALFYLPWDLLVKPVAVDEEVWFGIRFHGWAAKVLEIPHWIVYAGLAYGFWRMRPWMWPWASAYLGQMVIGFFVWPLLYQEGPMRWAAAIGTAGFFAIPMIALWRAKARFQPPPGRLRERYGEWALVTGASAGIGREFARALAADGVSCVLSARREDRLRELAAELEKNHSISTRVVVGDLSKASDVDALADALGDLEVAILVNNAGIGYAGRFSKLETERLRELVELNCVAPTVLTSRLLPNMVERGRGAVIITGSVAGRQPLPFHNVYSATKAFDHFLGESIWAETLGTGVDVLVLEPGSTMSEFHAVAGELPHPGEPADRVVKNALDALGQQPSVVSGWFNWLRANAATRLLPRSWVALIARGVVKGQTPEELR